eukprot:6212936-Pleurochrysis_carterae.AAC.1
MCAALKAGAKVPSLHSVESEPSAKRAAIEAPSGRCVESAVRRAMPSECEAAQHCDSVERCVKSAERAGRLRRERRVVFRSQL